MPPSEPANVEKQQLRRSPELMRPADTLLCLVDLQERLLPAIAHRERIVWNARRLVEGARLLGVKVAATEQYPEKLGPTVQPLSILLDEPAASKLVFSSALCGEFAQRHLEIDPSGETRRVLLAGIETHVCVQQTAYDLLAAGFQVFLAADATGTRFALDYEVALRRLESAGVVVTTTEAALFEWCIDAEKPEFKPISALIKEHSPEG